MSQLAPIVYSSTEEGGFHAPSISEFFPPAILFEGTPFQIDRILIIRVFATAVLMLLFWLGTRHMRVVPTRGQSVAEFALNFVRVNIAEEIIGKKDGKRFLPFLTAMFYMILAFNLTGVIPGLNLAGTSRVGAPLFLALITYFVFIYAGVKKLGGKFWKNSLFPAGAPAYMYVLLTPIEFLSTFVIRPVALTLRLLMNMVVGHLLLVLTFSATSFFLLEANGLWKLFSVGTFAFGFAFTLFELLVAVLQAYIFTLLSAVYIQLAMAEEH